MTKPIPTIARKTPILPDLIASEHCIPGQRVAASEKATKASGPFPGDGTDAKERRTVNVVTQAGILRQAIRPSSGDMTGVADGVQVDLTITPVSMVGTAVCASVDAATTGRDSLLISQCELPEDVSQAVFDAAALYAQSVQNLTRVSLTGDMAFGENASEQIAAMTVEFTGDPVGGFVAKGTIGIIV